MACLLWSVVVMDEKSAYINSEIYFHWLQSQFVLRKPAEKVLLIMDGHASHCSNVEIPEFPVNNDIILLSPPSHITRYLQPQDRIFFKSFESNYNQVCSTFMRDTQSLRITQPLCGQRFGFGWSKSAPAMYKVSNTCFFCVCAFFLPQFLEPISTLQRGLPGHPGGTGQMDHMWFFCIILKKFKNI